MTTFTVEGLTFKAKRIPRKQLAVLWKTMTAKPFPRVTALQLSDGDFDDVLRRRKCWSDVRRELIEWGHVLPAKGTDACIFNADESAGCDYIILVRENPYHRLKEVLEHELFHIACGDL
jgi:hypothetical protein